MSKSKNVGPSLTKHINLASGEKVIKFHMKGSAVVVESIDGDEKFDTRKLFPTEAENAEYLAEIDIIAGEEAPAEQDERKEEKKEELSQKNPDKTDDIEKKEGGQTSEGEQSTGGGL